MRVTQLMLPRSCIRMLLIVFRWVSWIVWVPSNVQTETGTKCERFPKLLDKFNQFCVTTTENCCPIKPIISGSLWWTCYIAKYVRTMVSAFKSGEFDTRQEGRQGTRKTAKTFEDVLFANTKTTRKAIGFQSTNCSQSDTRDGKDSEDR